jgi:type III pantothenate kinase
MHILAVDVGNTRTKWGLWNRGWLRQDSVPTADLAVLGEVWQGLPTVRELVACSVAGRQVGDWLHAWALARGLSVRWVISQREQCGVRNGYQEPSKLGADRWAALIAARHLTAGAALVVISGTASTIDALTPEGEFLGGLILPGLDMMAESLARGTAGLPRAPGEFTLFPRSTADSIASGAIQAVSGAVERMQRALAERGTEPQILLSGGAAEILHAHLGRPARVVSNLVLEGLRVIAESEDGR